MNTPVGPRRGKRVNYPIENLPGLWWPFAEPGDDAQYLFDLTAPLRGGELETVTVSVSPSGEGELIPWHVDVDGSIVKIRMFGGVPSRVYTTSIVATARGAPWFQRQWLIGLLIDPLLASVPVPVSPCPGFGEPIMWPCITPPYGPARNLPAFTVAATGTTQLTAAPVPIIAITLVNAGSGGGVQLTVPISKWNGYQPQFYNRSGGVITLYLYGSDAFEGTAAGEGVTIQNDQMVSLTASLGGTALIS